MKAIKLTSVLAAVLALTLIGTGCQKRPGSLLDVKKQQQVVRTSNTGDTLPVINPNDDWRNTYGTQRDTLTSQEQNPVDWVSNPDAHTEDAAALAAHTVHFDYDSSAIKSGEQMNVAAAADYIKNDPNLALRIDGHCDERGTEGYNDALGERRASALRDAVIALGADPSHVVTQSWGERKPVATGHDEAAYAQNRRGEFIVLRRK